VKITIKTMRVRKAVGEEKGEDHITKERLCNSCCGAEPTHQFCYTFFEKTSMGSREWEASNRNLTKYSKSKGMLLIPLESGRKNLGKQGCCSYRM